VTYAGSHADAVTDRLRTTREVAERLGLSTETELHWAKRGRLPAVYLSSRAIRFREDDLDAWLAARANGADTVSTSAPAPLRTAGGVTHPRGTSNSDRDEDPLVHIAKRHCAERRAERRWQAKGTLRPAATTHDSRASSRTDSELASAVACRQTRVSGSCSCGSAASSLRPCMDTFGPFYQDLRCDLSAVPIERPDRRA
jgi:excisionase family DNA binding protein